MAKDGGGEQNWALNLNPLLTNKQTEQGEATTVLIFETASLSLKKGRWLSSLQATIQLF